MSKPIGLVVYGDSDEDSDDGVVSPSVPAHSSNRTATDVTNPVVPTANTSDSIHPPPIPHCPWSACYDETSGFTYYWNQHTNAVTWEAPPEYLLALKLAQQQLNSGSTEVSAEEWQLYQQALAEKQQAKVLSKPPQVKMPKKAAVKPELKVKNGKNLKRGPSLSDDEDVKIELITSFSNGDSESNDELESPGKTPVPPLPKPQPKVAKVPAKKKAKIEPLEYGPSLPPNQSYTVPIGPDLPPQLVKQSATKRTGDKKPPNVENDDETNLLQILKDKAKILERLGGELPKDLKKIIKEERGSSPKNIDEDSRESKSIDTNIDDLLEEIEKKELPKIKNKVKIDIFGDDTSFIKKEVEKSPGSGNKTPPLDEIKPLFPSAINMEDSPKCLFPSAANIQENGNNSEIESKPPSPLVTEKKGVNLYIMNSNEKIENTSKRKLRISNSVLPEKPKSEQPTYTTKYSQFIDGFSSERTGLGFNKDDAEDSAPTNTISYGNGLLFTKGETLNEDKRDEDLDDLTDLIEMKLKHLNELQPCPVAPIQEMLVQMQTLASAFRAGALSVTYWRTWSQRASESLATLEQNAAPPLWRCTFVRSEGRYLYQRESDGFEQWEYPAEGSTDMDICTTPPHPGNEVKEVLPPLPPERVSTTPPPPPAWADPPPPGTEPPPEPPKPKQDDELMSFYNDIAELEKHSAPSSPLPPPAPKISNLEPEVTEESRETKKEKVKKKSKVKISSSMGVKHKTVSTLVAKWQQVAEEINSD